MSSKQNRSQEFKRAIDLGQVELASPTDLAKIWRIATGDEKAISLFGLVASVDRDILSVPDGNLADLEERVEAIEGGSLPPVAGEYVTEAAMIADQGNQLAQYIYFDGTKYWEYLGTTNGTIVDYREWTGGGGDFVSYDVADGKNATEKQQARDNIGSDAGIPQEITTDSNINNLAKTSNLLVFTGATANRNITGIVAGVDGEQVTIWNRRSFNLTLSNETSSSANNQFSFTGAVNLTLSPDQKITVVYSTAVNKWVQLHEYLRKDAGETTNGSIQWNTLDASRRVLIDGKNTDTIRVYGTDGTTVRSHLRTSSSSGMGNVGALLLLQGGGTGTGAIFTARNNTGTLRLGITDGSVEMATPPIYQNRSTGATQGTRRDELPYNYPETVATTGIIDDLELSNEGVKLLILTNADELTGVVPVTTNTGRELKIESRVAGGTIIRHDSASSTAANRFSLPSATDLTINENEIYTFIYTNGRWRRVL
jgi:hypothetical protein